MRINQFVASSSGLSRRAADTAIAAGRVRIGAQTAALGATVTPGATVTLDGRPLVPVTAHRYVALNKPAGYVSSRARQSDQPTLYALLPAQCSALRIAGRLDTDSSGLVILSDDGPFIQQLTHPSFGKTKEYELTLTKALSPEDQAKLERGVVLKDGLSRLAVLRAIGSNVTVTIGEGRNRQLRRTFGALGYGVERLHRTRIGSYELGKLASGQWRELPAPKVAS
ncbi:MAG TPA: pseudouridine synthase [Candidatus Saccharimonadia bacterium]|jgi:pseudouridine synthase|nr:pseudouridine synthase [Candidatus Saccharimonadia bacterium]